MSINFNSFIQTIIFLIKSIFVSSLPEPIDPSYSEVSIENLGGKIRFYDHHKCHSYCSHFLSGFNESLNISLDGRGERRTTSVNIISGMNMIILGWTYEIFIWKWQFWGWTFIFFTRYILWWKCQLFGGHCYLLWWPYLFCDEYIICYLTKILIRWMKM